MIRRIALLVFALALPVLAQEPAAAPAPAPAKKLTVLVKPAPPFSFQENGQWKGYSIDLWRRVAQESHFDFDFKAVTTVPEVIDTLKKREADVGVGALSITSQRQEVVDFSQGFYKSGLRALVKPRGQSSFWEALKPVFTSGVLGAFGVLFGVLVANAHLLWWLERRKNTEAFPEGYVAGVWEALWWSICTIMTGGCENKTPIGVPGRLLAIVWMVGCIGLTSFITANLSANLTTDKLTSDIKSIADLSSQPSGSAGTVKGSSAAGYLERQRITATLFDDITAACDALVAGKIKAVVYDEPLLRYYTSQHESDHLELVGDPRERQNYGFALQDGSPYRKEINRVLSKLSEEGLDDELDKKWFAPSE
jgi:polar amino acid transport system substrate-binding protein